MNESILLVDDEQALQMVLGDRLHKEGYLVDCASDAETGFSKATSQPFDLMIFDIMLPHRSGLDLCRDVRGAGLTTPILLLSAYQQTSIKTTGLEVGADDYMTKPFDMLELNARIESLLRRTDTRRFSDRKATPSQQTSTKKSAGSPAMASSQDRIRPPASGDRRLQEFERTIGAQKDFSSVAEVIPPLRQMLAEEMERPQTARDATLLGVTESIIQFLEEVFQGHDTRCEPDSRQVMKS
jgi:DNA-binding response OmpR family regulator